MSTPVVPSRNGKMNNRRSWQRYVTAKPSARPAPLTREAHRRLSASEREAWEDQRRLHLASFGPINTPQMTDIGSSLLAKLNTNYLSQSPGAKPAAAISGPAGIGKTTLVMAIIKGWERQVRNTHKWPLGTMTEDGGEFLPVVHTTVEATTTIKGWLLRLLRFFEAPVPKRATEEELLALALDYVRSCGTEVIVVDDMHNICMGNAMNAAMLNAHFKAFANDSGVTFVFTAVDLDNTGFMHEWQGRARAGMAQMPRRSTLYRLAPFTLTSTEARKQWRALLLGIEKELVLMNGRDGMLTDHADLIHSRTQGYFVSLMEQVRGAAHLAIDSGAERITEDLLLAVELDHAAEQQTPQATRKRKTRPPRRTIINKAQRPLGDDEPPATPSSANGEAA